MHFSMARVSLPCATSVSYVQDTTSTTYTSWCALLITTDSTTEPSDFRVSFVHEQARTDPNFKLVTDVSMQTFCNPVYSGLPDHDDMMRAASDLPGHSSMVSCNDGYKPEAMLFVDEEFSQKRVQRETGLVSLSFRPVVRFCSSHYRYVPDVEGRYRIVQVGIANDDVLCGLGFIQPPPREAAAGAALS